MKRKLSQKVNTGNASETNLQFKLLSAIGIIIIVSGHCYHGGISLGYEWFPTYSFNLALFVFISGYFYKDKHEEHIAKYIWKRTKRLLLPAYLWNVVYGLVILLLGTMGYSIGAEVNWYNLFIMPFVDGEAFQFNLGSWFVYPLFCVYLFNVLFRKLLKLLHCKNEYVILGVYLAIGIFGVHLSINNQGTGTQGLWLLLFRTMIFLPWFAFGKFYKEKLEKRDNLNSIAYFAIIFGIQLVILTFCQNLEYTPSKCSGFQNGCIVPYLTSITGIAFWLRISKLLTPLVKHWNFVRLISDNTYSIMIHQMIGYMSVKWLFYLFSVITPLFKDFNVATMKLSIWYYYLPNGLQQYGMLYLTGGIFVPILIGTVTHKLWQVLKPKKTIKQ